MKRHDLGLLDDYEVIGQPIVSPTRLAYRPWIDDAVQPYNATRLPQCTVHGLWDALRRCVPQEQATDLAKAPLARTA